MTTQSLLTFEASSPKELQSALVKRFSQAKPASRYVNLIISGPQVLTRLFQFAPVPEKELKNRLLHEAVDLLSLPVSEIDFAFQILNFSPTKISGVYICVPKKLLNNYLWVIFQANLYPVQVVPYAAVCLDLFLKESQGRQEKKCFINFLKEKSIYLTVLSQKNCELLREIPYENENEGTAEIFQSLRSVYAKSSVKQIDHICVVGSPPNELIDLLKSDLKATIEQRASLDLAPASEAAIHKNSMNLMKGYIFSLTEREQIAKGLHFLIVALVILGVLLSVKIKITDRSINNLKKTYKSSDFDYAVELERKTRTLK